MLIFLYGPNTYLIRSKLSEILDIYVEKNPSIPVNRFDFEREGDGTRLRDFLTTASMFEEKKMCVVESVFSIENKKEFRKLLERVLLDKSVTVVLIAEGSPPQSLSFLTEKPVVYQKFSNLEKGEEALGFVKREAVNRGIKLDQEAASRLSNYSTDPWFIATELDKLALIEGSRTLEVREGDYFKLTNVLKSGKTPQARLTALEILLSVRGDEPARIFNGLGYGFVSAEYIKRLAEYDVLVKSGRLEYEEALLDLALQN